MNKHHYGKPLSASVKDGQLVIAIGVNTLAHAVRFADWANPYDEQRRDYIRSFAITDPQAFAEEVVHMMLKEEEDGSTPLSDFLDQMTSDAVEDGSMACEYDQIIKHGEASPIERGADEPHA